MARVLVVEDNPDNMLLTIMLLESAGHPCSAPLTPRPG
jgi:CheY-like chemotaxis protein